MQINSDVLTGGLGVPSSNLGAPTTKAHAAQRFLASPPRLRKSENRNETATKSRTGRKRSRTKSRTVRHAFPLLRRLAWAHSWPLFDLVQSVPMHTLLQLEAEIAALTSNNCWFCEHDVGRWIAGYVQAEKRRRVLPAMVATAGWQP